jgi:hypothetical protein
MALADPIHVKLDGSYPIRFTGLALDLSCFSNVRAFFTGRRGSGPATPSGFSMSACSYNAGSDIVANTNTWSYPTYPDRGVYGLKFSIQNSIGSITGVGVSDNSIQAWNYSPQNYVIATAWEYAKGNYAGDTGYVAEGSPSPMYIGIHSVNSNYFGDGIVVFSPEPSAWALSLAGMLLLALVVATKRYLLS